jgi:hypothetical protein
MSLKPQGESTMSKVDQVVKHLKTRGHITSWQAIQLYRATRLADIIFNLRSKGMEINTVMCVKGKERYARYVYMGKK